MSQFIPHAPRPHMGKIRTTKPTLERVPVSKLRASQVDVNHDFRNRYPGSTTEPIELYHDPANPHEYHVLDGNHRAAAAAHAGMKHVTAMVHTKHPDSA